MTLESVMREVSDAAYMTAMGISAGFLVGSATGFLATALKISTTVNFMNFGVAVGVGLGVYTFLNHLIDRINAKTEMFKDLNLLHVLVKKVAVPIIAALAAIFVASYSSMWLWTIGAVAVGAFSFGYLFHPNVETRSALSRTFVTI